MVTENELREMLNYNPATGLFTWRCMQSKRVRVGDVAGSDNGKGYIRIQIAGKLYLAHRLAWLYMHGDWPVAQIDHINGNPTDNTISNLRESTQSENCQNRRKSKTRGEKPSRFTGVSWHAPSQRWQSHITFDGKGRNLGQFNSEEEAYAAYMAAKQHLHSFNPIPREQIQ